MSTPFPFPTEQNVQNTVIPTQGNVTRSATLPPSQPSPPSIKEEKKEEEKSSSSTILIVSVVIGLLVLGVGGYFAYKHLNKKGEGSAIPSTSTVSTPDSSVVSNVSTASSV